MLRTIERLSVFYNWGPAVPFPAARVAEAADVWLTAEVGVELHAAFYECPDEYRRLPAEQSPVVLFFHGNAGSIRRWRHIGSRWQDALGADVLVLDYRGYGRSSGTPTEAGLYIDARAAYEYLTQDRAVDPERIVIVGQSLGGGVAVNLAHDSAHAALVLESTFTRLTEVPSARLPWLPTERWMRNRFGSIDLLSQYLKPLFVSHGDRDWLIPYAHAERLVEATAGPVEFMTLPGMNHSDRRPPEYNERVRRFLAEHLPQFRGLGESDD
ncbi:alpha/beta hydrolase [Stratiformator vulcanicus]|uniref:2-succinyl-6-hydroxy-2, 4-cyclohexadiene-1-carboxylate synthase n=1 Tax=Stratiformator vulcanicus TaxID=2527980 RepID=A0A517R7D2_9PLAN|nr:alpha/beta hydrolase [Stratiformator vulcanicus]QDT39785.1 2-succinyl-6-hydroxy-2,4-cyclohexadiene-1-carboxylate synthase [Stratiformator vulcanicus]